MININNNKEFYTTNYSTNEEIINGNPYRS